MKKEISRFKIDQLLNQSQNLKNGQYAINELLIYLF